jgi:hypothetical protein
MSATVEEEAPANLQSRSQGRRPSALGADRHVEFRRQVLENYWRSEFSTGSGHR